MVKIINNQLKQIILKPMILKVLVASGQCSNGKFNCSKIIGQMIYTSLALPIEKFVIC